MAGRIALDWKADSEEYRWVAALGGITAATFLLAMWAGTAAGVEPQKIIFSYVEAIWKRLPLALKVLAGLLVLRAIYLRTFNPFRGLIDSMRARFGSPALILSAAVPLLLIPLLMGSFGTLKMLMPLARDFTWDDQLANADKILFLGYQPWQMTHALFGSGFLTSWIDWFYAQWVTLLYLSVLCFTFFAPRYDRARFFLSYGASWLLVGVIGAYLFPSAGPCYTYVLGAVSTPDFLPLMERLKEIHEGGYRLQAWVWQDVLWRAHSNRIYVFSAGISAMPSMHNAIAVLYALAAGRSHRLIGLVGWGYAALIFVGSVHLGWHYAVDGIAAGLMMWGIWVGAGAYLNRVGYGRAIRGGEAEVPELAGKPVAI